MMSKRMQDAITDTVEYMTNELLDSANKQECMSRASLMIDNYVHIRYGERFSEEKLDIIKEEAEIEFIAVRNDLGEE